MANDFSDVALANGPLAISAPRLRADAGAVVEFFGVVREMEGTERIAGIDYEANVEMAEHQMRKLAGQTIDRFGCNSLVLHHRYGFVPVAEASLFVRVMAPHRGAAFDACQWIIAQVKQDVPIWKRTVLQATPG